jgi:hypothetical protein
MEFLVANRRYITSFNIGNFYFRTFSDIYREAEKFGVRPRDAAATDADIDQQDYDVEHGMTMEEAERMSFELAREAQARIAVDDDGFEFLTASRYIKKKGLPAFDSHTLAYLEKYSNRWFSGEGDAEACTLDGETTLTVQPFVELRKDADDTRVVFSPRSAKILRMPARALDLFMACDGKTTLSSLASQYGSVGASCEPRSAPAFEVAGAPVPEGLLALFARGLREGLVAEAEKP